MDTLVIVSSEKVTDILDYTILIPAIEKSLAEFSKRTGVIQPVRNVVLIPESEGFLGCMPVYSREDDILAAKIVSFFPQNKDVSTHHAVMLIFCAHTGIPKALLDGDVITAKRTAATSAVATKYLVNGKPDVLALLGSGVQARSHVAALSELFTFKEIRIWNHRFDGAVKLAEEIGLNCASCRDVSEAVKNADVIVTVTSAKNPVLRLDWVKPGAHINAVGACRPDWSEIDADLMRSAVVYVDSREGALKESGDIILSQAEIYAEIGDVILGTREAMREKTTVFKSLGMAIEDGVAAKLVIKKLGIE
ncbi:ketimine reductase mu-crystallin [Biomphalaria pfeifferi]|uniref:Ketimine reductase mu-crystallin n=1 Tax=Biomphalaria pfeifferi TaxID=112525 RepID=A0AAD8FD22_BIOPF|nr:ketimine reductase mu-crystallin [Biomphalaria pfeifferi]